MPRLWLIGPIDIDAGLDASRDPCGLVASPARGRWQSKF